MKRQTCKSINPRFFTMLVTLLVSLPPYGMAADSYPLETISSPSASPLNWKQKATVLATKLRQQPQNMALREELLNLYIQTGQDYDANILLTQTYFQFPNRLEPFLMEVRLAIGPWASQDRSTPNPFLSRKLGRIAEDAEAINPNHPITLYLKGLQSRWSDNATEAESYFLKALGLETTPPDVVPALVDLYIEQNQLQLAVPLITQALEQDKNNSDTLFLLGKLFMAKDNPAKALTYFQQSQQTDPLERPLRLYAMSQAQQQLGETEAAIQSLDTLLTFWPERADLWVRYAQLCEMLGDDTRALGAYQQAYKRDPNILTPFLNKADAQFWKESLQNSRTTYHKIHQIAPDRTDVWEFLVQLHYRLWAEGHSPSSIALEELKDTRPSSSEPGLPDIQLDVMQASQWTPALQTRLNDFLADTSDVLKHLQGELLRHHPAIAQQLFTTQPFPTPLTGFDVKALALAGGWPWLASLNDKIPDSPIRPEWIAAWNTHQQAQASTALAPVPLFLKTQHLEQATTAIQKALVYHPLSGMAYLYQASIATQHKDWEQAHLALNTAKVLITTEAERLQLAELEKHVGQHLPQK